MVDLGRIRARARNVLTSPDVQKRFRRGIWGISDHALMSACNFIIMIILARVLTPRDLGLYALAFTILVFMNGVQTAIVSQPHTMLGAPKTGQDFVQYTSATIVSQAILALSSGVFIAIIAGLGSLRGWGAASMLMAAALGTAAWQMQDFIRRILYTRSRSGHVLINDIVSYGGQLLAVIVLWRVGHLTPVTAMLALAATSFIGIILGAWQVREWANFSPGQLHLRETFATNWHFGKWLLGGNLATWTSGRVYPLLAAGLVNVAATGTMKAVQTIMGPTHILMYAMEPMAGPHVAKEYAKKGIAGIRSVVIKLQLLILLTLGVYCLLIALFAKPILDLLYGPQYGDYAWLLVVVAGANLLNSLRNPLKLALTAMGETSAIFRFRLISSIANLTFGVAAVYAFGFPGVALGIVMDELVMQAIVWRFYLNFTRDDASISRQQQALDPGTSTLTST